MAILMNAADTLTSVTPCYVLVNADGREVDTDGQHFRTTAAAKDWWSDHGTTPDMPGLKQLDQPCHFVACARCGYVLDEEEWIYHFDTPADALSVAQGNDWKVIGERAWCLSEDCLSEAEREQGGEQAEGGR